MFIFRPVQASVTAPVSFVFLHGAAYGWNGSYIFTSPVGISANSDGASGSMLNNVAYIFGGHTEEYGMPAVNTIQSFNGISASTTLSVTLPAINAASSAATYSTDIFVFGGSNVSNVGSASGTIIGRVYNRNIVKFTGTTAANTGLLLANGRSNASAATLFSIIYLFGGFDADGASPAYFDAYNAAGTSLTAFLPGSMPVSYYAQGASTAVAFNNNIYVFGGWKSINPTNIYDIWKFDGSSITTQSSILPNAPPGGGQAAVMNGVISVNLHTFLTYDGTTLINTGISGKRGYTKCSTVLSVPTML